MRGALPSLRSQRSPRLAPVVDRVVAGAATILGAGMIVLLAEFGVHGWQAFVAVAAGAVLAAAAR